MNCANAVNPFPYLPVDDPNLPTRVSTRTPDNVPPERNTHTCIEAINPLPKSSVEGKQRKRKSQKNQKFCPEHHTKILLIVKTKQGR
jgi:hypothetical protein